MRYEFTCGEPPRYSRHTFFMKTPQFDIFKYWPESRWNRTPDFHKVINLNAFNHKVNVSTTAVRCTSNNTNCNVVDFSDYGVVVWGLFSPLRFRHFSFVSDNVYGINLDVSETGAWNSEETSLVNPLQGGVSVDVPVWRISLHNGLMLNNLLSKEVNYITTVLGANKTPDTLETASRYIMVRRDFSRDSMESARQVLPADYVWPVDREFYWDNGNRSKVLSGVMAEYKKGIALGMFAGHSNMQIIAQLISHTDVLNRPLWGDPPIKPVFYIPTGCQVAEFQDSFGYWLDDNYVIGEELLNHTYTPVAVVGHTLTYVAADIFEDFMSYLVNSRSVFNPKSNSFSVLNAPARVGDAHLFAMINGLNLKCSKNQLLSQNSGTDVVQYVCGSGHLYVLQGLGDPTLPMNIGVDRDGDQYRWNQDFCPFDADIFPQMDPDNDNIGTGCDNCPDRFNPDQDDLDGDGKGDVCEGSYIPPVEMIEDSAKAGILGIPFEPVYTDLLDPGRYRIRIHVPGISKPKVPLILEVRVSTKPFSIIYSKKIKIESDKEWTHTFTVTSRNRPVRIEFIASIDQMFPSPHNLTCNVPVTITTWNEDIPLGFGMDKETLNKIIDVKGKKVSDSLVILSRKDMNLKGRVVHMKTASGHKLKILSICPLYMDMGLESSNNFGVRATIGVRTLKSVDYPRSESSIDYFNILPADGSGKILKSGTCAKVMSWKQDSNYKSSDDVLELDIICSGLSDKAHGLVFCMPDASDVYLDNVEVKTW